VRFASFLSGGFTTMAELNRPERKLAKRTSVHYADFSSRIFREIAAAFCKKKPFAHQLQTGNGY
jgi:hypothetical protein